METKAQEHEVLISRTFGEEALNHAISAAELYMKAADRANTTLEKTRLRKKFRDMLLRGEAIKRENASKPRMTRVIPSNERAILLFGSQLHGNRFPPWDSDPGTEEFELDSAGSVYTDSSCFALSERQQAIFAGWKRPSELFGPIDKNVPTKLMNAEQEYDLVQDITTDCSVVASLCASMRHLKPGPASRLGALIFPSDNSSGTPYISKNGKYIFKMYFNGCSRKVAIDDRLPASKTSRTLYVVDRQNPYLIWPALMEKAYLKIRGGYDFPGSNSGTDLWIIMGWIPEQMFLQSEDFDPLETWNRIKDSFDHDDVVVTLGTGRLAFEVEETLGLAGEHDYAVLDISEAAGSRRLLVKNPWCDGLVWKGVGSSDTSAPSEGHAIKLSPGSFWMSYDDVTQNFESLYLNWKPSRFAERQDHHFTWQLPKSAAATSFAHNPQYSMLSPSDGEVWVLLSRHFLDKELNIARKNRSGSSTPLSTVSNELGFMSLYIFDNKGKRVQLSDNSVYRGPYVDSPQTLARFAVRKGVPYTIVVSQHGLPLPAYNFTMCFFSQVRLEVRLAEQPMMHYEQIEASWTRRTAGGNSEAPTYLQNPQFSITVTSSTPLSVLLSASDEDIPVHVDLVWAHGRRVTAVSLKDIVASSGEYRRGCASLELPVLDAGTYTVVCSTFAPGQLADFFLRIGSMVPSKVQPVLADAAGQLRTQLAPVVFRTGQEKHRAVIMVPRLTKASVVIEPRRGSSVLGAFRPVPSVRASIEYGRGPNKTIIAVTGNGELQDVGKGLRTTEVDLEPHMGRTGGLYLVVEQIGRGQDPEGLEVAVLCDNHLYLSPWELIDD